MFKFYNAYNSARTNTPRERFQNELQSIFERDFENAPNVFYNEIEIEKTYGSNKFEKIPMVRVDSIVDFNTGIALGDDFKMFVFMPDFIKPLYGMKFKWNDDYWLVINTNNAESLAVSAEVRRCNNVLRFFDSAGKRVIEPCIFDYTLRFTNNREATLTVGNGELKVWCQRNSKTVKIKANDKFLFGTPEQRVGFRVNAGGIQNLQNTITGDDTSPTLTQFFIEHYEINAELDDLVNGYANAYDNRFTVDINNINTTYEMGLSVILTATTYKNDNIVNMPIKWRSSNTSVATITDGGVLTTIANGSTTISAFLSDNNTVVDSVDITISNTIVEDDYKIIITPDVDYILQGKTVTFNCVLYKNGVQLEDEFVFQNITENVPAERYIITPISANSFSITNKALYLDSPVLVKCISNEHERTLEIILRGLY